MRIDIHYNLYPSGIPYNNDPVIHGEFFDALHMALSRNESCGDIVFTHHRCEQDYETIALFTMKILMIDIRVVDESVSYIDIRENIRLLWKKLTTIYDIPASISFIINGETRRSI